MKKLLCLVLCAIFVFCAFGCNKGTDTEKETEAETKVLEYDGKNAYKGFENIPEEYTAEQAVKDGCLVIEVNSEDNGKAKVSGSDVWYTFLTKSNNAVETTMRVAYFIDGKATYEDLYFADGRYSVFSKNDNGVYKKSDYTMILLLEKEDGTDAFYVLTDSEKLTYEDAYPLLADANAESDINFDFIPFTFYIAG